MILNNKETLNNYHVPGEKFNVLRDFTYVVNGDKACTSTILIGKTYK